MAIKILVTAVMADISTHLDEFRKNPLYKNSFFITLSRFSNVFVGLIFWIVASRLYSIEDVGIATALISSMYIVISLSRLGFDFSIIRFIHINDKAKVFNTSIIITTIASLMMGIIYISGINIFSSNLFLIQRHSYMAIFLLFVIMNSLVLITGIAFTAIRKADHYLFQNIILASRVPLLIPLAFLGSFGIFGSVGLAFLFSALFSLIYLNKFVKFNCKIDKQFVKESFTFSFGNYASSIFTTTPAFILPIMVLSLSGEAAAAKYYIAFAIGSLVMIIPEALCTSLFIEGSHGESLKKNVFKVGLTIYSFLIPAIILIYFFGDYILCLFGKNYDSGLLKLLAFSSIFSALLSLFVSIQNVRMQVKMIVKTNFLMFLLLLSLSYFFMLRFGIIGIGYAWIITYIILDLIIGILIKKLGWI
jgi:O-antigen/teichoic acid export membrane protein